MTLLQIPRPTLLAALALALVWAAWPAPYAPAARASEPASLAGSSDDERFVYRWELRKLASLLGGILLPGQGEGALTVERSNGNLKSELLITSEQGGDGEYWRYGAVIDPDRGRTIRAWSSYFFRGETKSKREEIEEDGVVDVASGIYLLRQDPPDAPRRMRIWSDGKVYPVVVVPKGTEPRTLPSGEKIQTTHYSIEGVDVPGERRWKGSLELWLAHDEAATPVEIRVVRTFAGVRLELAEMPE